MGLPHKLKDFRTYIDGERYAGEIAEVTLPKIATKYEAWRGGSMIGEVDIDMGMEKMEAELTAGGLLKNLLKQFGAIAHDAALLRFVGAYRPEGGGAQALDVTMRGRLSEVDWGGAKSGGDTEHKYKYTLTYFKLNIDGVDIIEVDIVAGTLIVDGTDRRAELTAILDG